MLVGARKRAEEDAEECEKGLEEERLEKKEESRQPDQRKEADMLSRLLTSLWPVPVRQCLQFVPGGGFTDLKYVRHP